MDNKENSKRIAKNTILLYFRMIITMAVSLYTSRVILDVLGVEDYGINNVVAGVVSMFGFLTSSLSAAISRFLTFELGKGQSDKLRLVYSTSINIMLAMSVVIALLIEVGGVWFLNNKLNIPADRMMAANWVFHFAVIGFVLNMINIPFNAVIIAHEKMNVFAYISILEVTLKLVIVYGLCISPFDKLITYAALFCSVSLVLRIVYGWYCSHHFAECRYQRGFDKSVLKEISGFAGWNLLGSAAYIFNTQGVNIVTNLFFGVALNAARGVTTQVEGIVKQFVTNFTTALNPQIIKSYAAGNIDYMNTLVCRGAKYSWLMMLVFAVPLTFEADYVLNLWLVNPPEHTALFIKLSLFGAMIDMMGNATANACWATGKVKRYYQYVASVGCLPFFLSWGAFAMGLDAYWAYIAFIIVYIILIFVKLYILRGLMRFPIMKFVREVLVKITMVTVVAFVLPALIWMAMPESLVRFLLVGFASVVSILSSTYLLGLEASEKQMVHNKILSKLKR